MVRELLRALARDERDHHYVLFARERWAEQLPGKRFSWQLSRLPNPWWNVRVGVGARRSCDVLLCTNTYLAAWFTRLPTVVVVHDLVAFDATLRPQRRVALIERATLPVAARRATEITAVSQATVDDLVRRFPVAAGKTTVTRLAADSRFGEGGGSAVAEVRDRYGLERPYVLAVGTIEPRKNLPRLIEAFNALPAALRSAHDLVLVGAAGWQTGETLGAAAAHRDLVRVLGHVPDVDLPALYSGAALFAYPSLYEGFGLPVLEAMAAGVPVLTSARSALPEVAGDAAIYCDPFDVRSIRAGLERGLADPDAAAKLAQRGRLRAARFSWDDFASGTLAAIERAASRR